SADRIAKTNSVSGGTTSSPIRSTFSLASGAASAAGAESWARLLAGLPKPASATQTSASGPMVVKLKRPEAIALRVSQVGQRSISTLLGEAVGIVNSGFGASRGRCQARREKLGSPAGQ